MLAYVQGASDSLPHPSPGSEVEASIFGIAVRALLQATSLPHCMVSSAPGQGLSVSAFKGCNSALKAFLFCSAETSRSPELLHCPRNFLWSGGPVQFCQPSWVVSLLIQNLIGASWSSSGHTKCVFLLRDALFILASASAGRFGVFHAMSFPGSLSWSGGGMSLAFVTGFVAKTQAPPLLLGLRASLYWPNQREAISAGDCYILCGQSGVTWSAWAAHRQRCEQSFLPQGVTWSYRRPLSPSGSGCRCHGCASSRSRNGLFRVP